MKNRLGNGKRLELQWNNGHLFIRLGSGLKVISKIKANRPKNEVWSVRARSPGPCTNRVYKLNPFTNFCQAFFGKKLHKHFPKTLCILHIDFYLKICYTISVKRRGERNVLGKALPKVEYSVPRVENPTLQGSKKFLKNFSKTS